MSSSLGGVSAGGAHQLILGGSLGARLIVAAHRMSRRRSSYRPRRRRSSAIISALGGGSGAQSWRKYRRLGGVGAAAQTRGVGSALSSARRSIIGISIIGATSWPRTSLGIIGVA